VRTGFITASTPLVSLGTFALGRGTTRRRSFAALAGRYLALGSILIFSWYLLITAGVAIYSIYVHPIGAFALAQIRMIPYDLASSIGRLIAAYTLSLVIAFPLAYFLTHRPRAARIGLPLVEIVASVPATAIFPLIVFVVVLDIGRQATSVILLSTGMIWYLFFNLLSGMRSIPPDLDEAARSFGVKGGPYYRKVLLPAVFPAFITGSITALGGGWNTLIVAEYLSVSKTVQTPTGPVTTTHVVYQVPGIGQLIQAGFAENSAAVYVAALLALVVTVVVVNELLWKPLYRRAIEKYKYD